ncbi:hypothetical protein [Streptomyces sp. NPDC002588]|uniref:hypothetical protein n=1 Tax=Streptomyces sp. NPDC002588 TaxID=3154419 RepID=UPI003319969D
MVRLVALRPRPRSHREGDWLIGMGTATAIYGGDRIPAQARVGFEADGTATTDLGTGARTVTAADALGIPMQRAAADLGDSALPRERWPPAPWRTPAPSPPHGRRHARPSPP